jgi:hypothetical protein
MCFRGHQLSLCGHFCRVEVALLCVVIVCFFCFPPLLIHRRAVNLVASLEKKIRSACKLSHLWKQPRKGDFSSPLSFLLNHNQNSYQYFREREILSIVFS